MRSRLVFTSLVVAAFALPLAAEAAHPKVAGAETCEGCHSDSTPRVFREWKESRHGIDLVKCLVCHGSTGADFKARPAMDRCTGCHADQVASMRSPAMKGKTCFSCHSPHALDPHVTSPAMSTAAKLGADKLGPMVTVEGRIPPPAPATPAAAPAPAAAPPAPAATPAAPGAGKDVNPSLPHPPTDR